MKFIHPIHHDIFKRGFEERLQNNSRKTTEQRVCAEWLIANNFMGKEGTNSS
jgi:hypothetical protein